MKFGILGTGMVGQTIGSKLASRGHEVKLGGRTASGASALEWAERVGEKASVGTFVEAATFGDVVFLCVKGEVTEEVVRAATASALEGKLLIDITNPLDFTHGFPPTLSITGRDSLGERVQSLVPGTKVVKALNTVAAPIMVEPSLLEGSHDLFVCGNDADGKAKAAELLRSEFGWETIHDVGGIEAARGTESLLPLWTRLYGCFGTPLFNFHINRSSR